VCVPSFLLFSHVSVFCLSNACLHAHKSFFFSLFFGFYACVCVLAECVSLFTELEGKRSGPRHVLSHRSLPAYITGLQREIGEK